MTIGERIKKIRVERGLSQAQLGVACGWTNIKYSGTRKYDVAQLRISHYEKSDCEPSINQLYIIAKALKTSVTYLATGITKKQSKND